MVNIKKVKVWDNSGKRGKVVVLWELYNGQRYETLKAAKIALEKVPACTQKTS